MPEVPIITTEAMLNPCLLAVNTDIKHKNEYSSVLEFLDFYRKDDPKGNDLKYLVFDSKFTHYENLKKLDESGTIFVTIRRRGKNIVDQIKK